MDRVGKKFIGSFPSSSGKRKCLTVPQFSLLKKLGVAEVDCKLTCEVNIKQKPKHAKKKEDADDKIRRNNRL